MNVFGRGFFGFPGGYGWVGLWLGWVVPREVGSSARRVRSRPPPLTPADGHHRCFCILASPPSKACAMRSPASSEQRVRPSGLLCGRLLVALVESVLRPGGWESMCRLMCHCVRHISLDNKYGRSVKAIHSSRSRWTACTELCAGTHQEDRRTARRARWGARTVRGAHGGFGSPPWCGQFPPGLTA